MSKIIPIPTKAPAPVPGTAPGAVRRILMVEDDANDAELLQAYLAQAWRDGAEVLRARTLAEGLELQRTREPQLTLLDLDLPDSSGFYTLERMRAAAAGPVVVISGNGHPQLVDEALARGAYDVIPKQELDASTLRRVLRLATLHHEAGRAQRASEGRFRALLENSGEALVLFDAAGRIGYASASMRRVLGYDSAEVLGRNGLAFVHEEDRETVRAAFPRLVANPGSTVAMRVRFVHKDGSLRLLESTLVNRLGDADVAAVVCSYRNLMREEEERARFDATFENAAVGLAHVDLEGRILLANRRLCAMLGYAREELVGRTVREMSHPEDLEATAAERAQLRAGSIPQFSKRKRYLRKDGAVLWVQLTVSAERDARGALAYEIAAFEDVSEAMRAEERLRASEARLRAIVGAEPECVKVLDEEGVLLDMNPAGLAMIEAEDLGTVAGRSVYGLVAPGSREAFRALVERACRGERGILEFEVVGLKGTRRWMETHAVPLQGEAGGRPQMLGITRDVTERKLAESAARRLTRMYAALGATNEAILKAEDAPALYRRVCELLVEHGGIKLAAVRLVDPATRWLETVAHAGEPAAYLAKARVSVDPALPNAHGPAAKAVREASTMVNNDYLADPMLALWHAVARESGIGSTMSVPLRRGGAVVGLITLYAAEAGWFDPELVGLAERMAQNVSFALDSLDRDAALRESEGRFRSLTEMSSDFYWETDAQHRFTLRGSGAKGSAVASFRDNGMLGKARWELPYLTPDREGWRAHQALLDAHRPFRDFEFSRAGVDGDERFITISGDPVFDALGNFAGYRGVGTDLTDKKLAQHTLELEHAVVRYLAGAETAQAGLQAVMRSMCERSGWETGRYWQADAAAGVLRFGGEWAVPGAARDAASADARATTFAPGAGLAGRVWQSGEPLWIADVGSDARVQRSAAAARAGVRSVFLFPVRAESRILGVLAFANPRMRRPDERLLRAVGVIGSQIGQFLSRMRAEQATRESEERFRSLTELSSDWYWEQDAAFRFTKVGVERDSPVFGPDAAVLGKARWDLPLAPLSCSWEEHRADLEARRTFRDFEYSYAGGDGRLRYVAASGYPVRDAEGRFLGYRGIAKDITARYRAREELRLSHERFEIVSRATNDVLWDWNLVTDELWWNDNLCKHYGYAPEEVGALSDSRTSRIHPEDLPRVKAEVEGAIAAGAKSWSGEYRFRRKDGSYAEVYDRGVMMHDAQGRAVRMTGALMDVSDRKLAEGRLRAHGERQAAVARFGQFAIGRRSVDELYTEAARALHCGGVDAVCLLEMHTARREFLVRAAHGEGPHASIGLTGPMSPDSVWPDILRENAPRIAGRKYLAERPLDRPWRAWLRRMGSAVYAPVRDDAGPIAMLCMYAEREHAFGADEVRFAEAVSHVLSTALQRQKAEERLARMAQFDALTGLPNRTLLQDRLGQTIVQSRRRQLHAGVLFVDLDRFKLVNDTLGHHQGDALIQQVGQRLLACVRPGDTVGRISGDEFGVVLADMARPDDAALVGQKILEALAVPFDLGGNEAYVTGSIGIAVYPGDGDDAETLLKNADMAMYRAKESARNSYCFFTAEMNQRSVAKVQLNADLRHALERAEFALHYQPKVDLASGALRGLEALLRWNHPARGLVSPAEFVPALEDSGLIVPVGEWVVAEACAQIRRWQAAGLAPVPVAVNLSAKQFLRRDLDGMIQRSLAAAGVPARLIELEITESSLMDNPEEAVRAMNALRAAGLKISVDDFGTGYSSLAYLARFPLSALKIDRAFVRNVHLEGSAAAIVRAVIDMANNLGLQVVAEGVETEQQAAFLRGHGCHQAQGFLYSRPVPPGEIAGRLPRA